MLDTILPCVAAIVLAVSVFRLPRRHWPLGGFVAVFFAAMAFAPRDPVTERIWGPMPVTSALIACGVGQLILSQMRERLSRF